MNDFDTTDNDINIITTNLSNKKQSQDLQLPPSISASHIEILSAEESIGNTNIERISASLIEKETNNDNNNVVTNNPDQADVYVRAEVEVLDSDDDVDDVEVVIPNTHALIHRSHLSQLKKKAQVIHIVVIDERRLVCSNLCF